MSDRNPFERTGDPDYDVYTAEKFFVLVNLHKKWGYIRDKEGYDICIVEIVFRNKSWSRMDIVVEEKDGSRFQTAIGEFLEHYEPEGAGPFDAEKLFQKKVRHYGYEYVEETEWAGKLRTGA